MSEFPNNSFTNLLNEGCWGNPPAQYASMTPEQFQQHRKGFRSSSRKDRTLMRLEELRFLATSTKDLDDDAYWIKKQKRLIKNKMRNDLGDEDNEDE
ncbi:hypothetical protein Tco_0434703 [Tanacetum coccineum]